MVDGGRHVFVVNLIDGYVAYCELFVPWTLVEAAYRAPWRYLLLGGLVPSRTIVKASYQCPLIMTLHLMTLVVGYRRAVFYRCPHQMSDHGHPESSEVETL